MINTVLGPISEDDLGITLIHEHILVDLRGADQTEQPYTIKDVMDLVLDALKDAKKKGLVTMLEPTPLGLGRDIKLLKQCSEQSGVNIITCVGAWDGEANKGKNVPEIIRNAAIDEIVAMWVKEFEEGIDNTGVKPGFIKLAMGDEGELFPLQEKLLQAAARTSIKTGMVIHCHIFDPKAVLPAIKILEEENLPLEKFVWLHADGVMDMEMILEAGKKGILLSFDGIGWKPNYEGYPAAIKKLIEENMLSQLVFGQDSGSYFIMEGDMYPFRPYARFFDEFIPYCVKEGIDVEVFNKVITENAKRALI